MNRDELLNCATKVVENVDKGILHHAKVIITGKSALVIDGILDDAALLELLVETEVYIRLKEDGYDEFRDECGKPFLPDGPCIIKKLSDYVEGGKYYDFSYDKEVDGFFIMNPEGVFNHMRNNIFRIYEAMIHYDTLLHAAQTELLKLQTMVGDHRLSAKEES